MLDNTVPMANYRRRTPRVAIIHYWLVTMRGGERVLEQLLRLFPHADVYTHVYKPEMVSQTIRSADVRTTFIQRLPRAAQNYKTYLPLMPFALEEIDLRGYDLVISSESGPAKGVLAPPDATHICYCHSPMRYLWDHYHQYRDGASRMGRTTMSTLFPSMRAWDNGLGAARRPYLRQFALHPVAHPPRLGPGIDGAASAGAGAQLHADRGCAGRISLVGQMTAYKRPDIAVEAFNRLGLPLLMIGDGEMLGELRRKAKPNIRFVRWVNYSTLRLAFAQCKALVFTAEEDFGIVPVEANASGRPVIGYGRGGLKDTIIPGETGFFFDEQSTDALTDAVASFQRWGGDLDPESAVANARRFSPEVFQQGFVRKVREMRPDLHFDFEQLPRTEEVERIAANS